MRNLITDVPGLLVGNASDERIKTGTTVLLGEESMVASVHVMGGAPGTVDTDLLDPDRTVEAIDAVVLSGGSAFGLDAAGGVRDHLVATGRGLAVGGARVPIVPGAILFDLINGGDKAWGARSPYYELGREAVAGAGLDFEIGTAGAGTGATTAGLKGGLGSASAELADGTRVGALVAVNSVGRTTVSVDRPHFWSAPFERDGEFGGLGWPDRMPPDAGDIRLKYDIPMERANTTIAVVATDAALSKAQARRLAVSAHDGMARAIWPAHTPSDGDLVFAVSTGRRPAVDPGIGFVRLLATATQCLARAIARGVYLARAAEGDIFPTWAERFGPAAKISGE